MEFLLSGEPRSELGRAKSRTMRRTGRVPAIIYGGGKDPAPISLDFDLLNRQISEEAFYTSILTIDLGGDRQPVIVKEVQRHPARGWVLHLDFQRILADEEITLNVPIHFVGEDQCKGVREEGGVVDHMVSDIEVTCLPGNLPEYIEVDVSGLALNDVVHLSEIKLPEGVRSVALEHEQDPALVAINMPRAEEQESAAAGEVEAGEVPTASDEADSESGDEEG